MRESRMKIALALETWRDAKDVDVQVGNVQLADELGYHSVWTAEAYGADAITPLAYLAPLTKRIRLGTSVVQISARTATATAMAFATLDSLAGRGRVIAGIGLSGPVVVEGWYGQPWSRPIARTRDYVAIMRNVLAREGPLAYSGEVISAPYQGADATDLAKPLKSILHTNPSIPIYIGAGGPQNVALAAEIADGWLSSGLDPWNFESFRPNLQKGADRAGRQLDDLEIHASTWVEVTDDVSTCLERLRESVALYVGGMGAPEKNFHTNAMFRRGEGDAALRIQELFVAGRRRDAVSAVPLDYCDDLGLFGTPKRIAERFQPWLDSEISLLSVRARQPEAIRLMADLVR